MKSTNKYPSFFLQACEIFHRFSYEFFVFYIKKSVRGKFVASTSNLFNKPENNMFKLQEETLAIFDKNR